MSWNSILRSWRSLSQASRLAGSIAGPRSWSPRRPWSATSIAAGICAIDKGAGGTSPRGSVAPAPSCSIATTAWSCSAGIGWAPRGPVPLSASSTTTCASPGLAQGSSPRVPPPGSPMPPRPQSRRRPQLVARWAPRRVPTTFPPKGSHAAQQLQHLPQGHRRRSCPKQGRHVRMRLWSRDIPGTHRAHLPPRWGEERRPLRRRCPLTGRR
jgi:hypothetical protein